MSNWIHEYKKKHTEKTATENVKKIWRVKENKE